MCVCLCVNGEVVLILLLIIKVSRIILLALFRLAQASKTLCFAKVPVQSVTKYI